MNGIPWSDRNQLTFMIVIVALTPCIELNAARVGFSFGGALTGSSSDVPLFGISVPGNSEVSGTFSYDTTVAGVIGPEQGTRDFPQQIAGGFTLNIGNKIHLSASKYIVEVADDFEIDVGEFADTFGVQFARTNASAPDPVVLLNGVPYSGTAVYQLGLNWPSDSFEGPDEPKLTADRPIFNEAERGSFGFVGPGSGRLFTVPAVSLVAFRLGDFNRNGAVDMNDYIEWKAAYGGSTEPFLHADGNNDQVVNAADYTVWRNKLSGLAASTFVTLNVPEPSSVLLAATVVVALIVSRNVLSCRRGRT